jgi:hypothetical protein
MDARAHACGLEREMSFAGHCADRAAGFNPVFWPYGTHGRDAHATVGADAAILFNPLRMTNW